MATQAQLENAIELVTRLHQFALQNEVLLAVPFLDLSRLPSARCTSGK
jgi:hypothetical protein